MSKPIDKQPKEKNIDLDSDKSGKSRERFDANLNSTRSDNQKAERDFAPNAADKRDRSQDETDLPAAPHPTRPADPQADSIR